MTATDGKAVIVIDGPRSNVREETDGERVDLPPGAKETWNTPAA